MSAEAVALMPTFPSKQAEMLIDLLTKVHQITGESPSEAALGSNIIVNGDFAIGLGNWTNTGWTWSASQAVHTAGNTNALSQTIPVVAGTYYLIQSTIIGVDPMAGISNVYVNGTLCPGYNSVETTVPSTNYASYIAITTGNVTFEIRPTTDFVSSYDNISMWPVSSVATPILSLFANGETNAAFQFTGSYDSGNMGVGYYALRMTGIGQNNVAFGKRALSSNISGNENAAFGTNALGKNTTGYANMGIGFNALGENTAGFSNTAVGGSALSKNTYGTYNTAIGLGAMSENEIGISNTAIGVNACFGVTGNYNIGIGSNALGAVNPNTGTHNIAIGVEAGREMTSGKYNEFVGHDAGRNNSTGQGNDAVGHQALYTNTTGNNNVAVGYQSGTNLNGGLQNTFIGASSADGQLSGNSNICIGFSTALPSLTGNNQLNIGNFLYGNLSSKQMVWGQSAVVAGATLALVSTTQGFLPPKMTSTQRDAIATPPSGLIIFNTTTNKLNVYGAAAWEAITSV
jgi:trimeric autotransporter adhesin